MKVFLMYKDRDFDPEADLPSNAAALTQDLELDTLFGAMAAGDKFLLEVARKAVLTSLVQPEAILYRQHILADCLEGPAIIREMYAIAVEAIEREKKVWGVVLGRYPEGTLRRSVEVLNQFMDLLKRLSAVVHKFGNIFFHAAARDPAETGSILARSLARSWRVNFHSNGFAIAS